jgi:site-specific recombinase XerD
VTGRRLSAIIVVLWRSGLRISEVLALEERDLDPVTGAVTVRSGKGGKRRIVGMDPWAWEQIAPWLNDRQQLPPGPVFCVVHGPTAGRHLTPPAVRQSLREVARTANIRRRIAPHQLRHCHAVELVREGVPVHILQRQLGHANLAVTTIYLSSVAPEEVLTAALHRPAPTVSVHHMLL